MFLCRVSHGLPSNLNNTKGRGSDGYLDGAPQHDLNARVTFGAQVIDEQCRQPDLVETRFEGRGYGACLAAPSSQQRIISCDGFGKKPQPKVFRDRCACVLKERTGYSDVAHGMARGLAGACIARIGHRKSIELKDGAVAAIQLRQRCARLIRQHPGTLVATGQKGCPSQRCGRSDAQLHAVFKSSKAEGERREQVRAVEGELAGFDH